MFYERVESCQLILIYNQEYLFFYLFHRLYVGHYKLKFVLCPEVKPCQEYRCYEECYHR